MSGWIRFNADAPQHHKVACLTDAEFRAWVVMLCNAKTRSDDSWANARHMEECVGKYARHRDALVQAGLMERDGDAYILHDFAVYQIDPTNADRQRRHRDKSRGSNAPVTPEVTVPVTAGNAQTGRDSTGQDKTRSAPARAREDDAAVAYFEVTTRVPSGRSLSWLNELATDHGEAALCGAIRSTDADPIKTFLSRVQLALTDVTVGSPGPRTVEEFQAARPKAPTGVLAEIKAALEAREAIA